MLEVSKKIELLYNKDTSIAYRNLQELERLSEKENILYTYFDTFLEMSKREEYVIRVRGIRLLCKQAKWDCDNKIEEVIDDILNFLSDEKPTAVRQALKALEDIIRYKKSMREKIKRSILFINYSYYKDTMKGLIRRDAQNLLEIIENDYKTETKNSLDNPYFT